MKGSGESSALERLIGETYFALTEMEVDFIHTLGGLVVYPRNHADLLKEYVPSQEIARKYAEVCKQFEKLGELVEGWREALGKATGGRYPHRLHELETVEEVIQVKNEVGRITLEYMHRFDPLVKGIERVMAGFDLRSVGRIRRETGDRRDVTARCRQLDMALRNNIMNLRKLIDGFTSLEKHKIFIEPTADVHRIIRELIGATDFFRTRQRTRGGKRNIKVATLLQARNPIVAVSSLVMYNLVVNAVSNAMKALGNTADGSGRIIISSRETPKRVVISIKDSGKGIPVAKRKEVMQWGVSGTGSSGLGLPLMRVMTKASGGNVRIKSRIKGPERGTEVIFSLPKKIPRRRMVV